jgi:hypothetical protein
VSPQLRPVGLLDLALQVAHPVGQATAAHRARETLRPPGSAPGRRRSRPGGDRRGPGA